MGYLRIVLAISSAAYLMASDSAKAEDPEQYKAALVTVSAMDFDLDPRTREASWRRTTLRQLTTTAHMAPNEAETMATRMWPVIEAHTNAVREAKARIFANHFTTKELEGITAFYKDFFSTPVGKKFVVERDAISEETLTATRQVGATMAPGGSINPMWPTPQSPRAKTP